MYENEYGLPLGLCRQAVMKIDSAMVDINEIAEDSNLDPIDKENFNKMSEILGMVMAHVVNLVSKECEEEEFLSEVITMDKIDSYPDGTSDEDILDTDVM